MCLVASVVVRSIILANTLLDLHHLSAIADDATSSSNICEKEASVETCEVVTSSEADVTPNPREQSKCKLYLAESTIPNAGLGMFTALDLSEDSEIGYGDIVIPLIQMNIHNGNRDYFFLWEDYFWDAASQGKDFEREVDDPVDNLNGCSPGIGAAVNCHAALTNVDKDYPTFDAAGLDRRRDPGAGAFTPYHNRRSRVTYDVEAGSELFVDYGEDWFRGRTEVIGLVPLWDDFEKADLLLEEYARLRDRHGDFISGEVEEDLWELIVDSPYEGRTTNALPKSLDAIEDARELGTADVLFPRSVRSLEWLESNGQCMDNIRPGRSTIPQAGRGAFATRFIPRGGLVAPGPLLHIPDRRILTMYDVTKRPDGTYERNLSTTVGHQLLLNYCFGHRNSTLLLSPYGAVSNLINHSGQSPNVIIQWPKKDRFNHNADWFNLSVDELNAKRNAGLAFDYIATRDIRVGEEIFLNYGPEWEGAWNRHVETWVPPPDSETYARAAVLNDDMDTPLRTEQEQRTNPYGVVELRCSLEQQQMSFPRGDQWNWTQYKSSDTLKKYLRETAAEGDTSLCKILSRDAVDGIILYTAEIIQEKEEADETLSSVRVLEEIPREAFIFVDPPYSSDLHLRDAFRHEIGIPDDMFPAAWMNK